MSKTARVGENTKHGPDEMEDLQISDLPPEMLSSIFRNLKIAQDCASAGMVCKLWRSVICNTIGVPMMVGNGSDLWRRKISVSSSSIPWRKLEEITKIGISDCVFSNVIQGPVTVPSAPVTFLLPNLLNKLQFDGFISQNIYQNLCSSLGNLSTIVFHATTLTFLTIQLREENFNVCQSLKTLVLTSKGFEKHHFHSYNIKRLFQNVISICGSYFPRLKKFDSTLPIFLDKEIQVYEEITKFLDRHHTTLDELELRWTHKWRVETETSSRRTVQELNVVNDALFEVGRRLDALGVKYPTSWTLKSIVFVIEDFDTIIPTSLGLKKAILDQTRLESIFYMCWDFIAMPVELISRNASTLTDIGLTIDDITEPIDCMVFTECENLSRLVLQTDGQITFDDLANEAPRLLNASRLPTSLKCVQFRNIYVEAQSVDWISKNLPNLDTLILINIGRVDNLGITMPCLLWILRESPNMTMVKVKGINNCCYLATFGFDSYSDLRLKCPVCQSFHFKNDEQGVGLGLAGEDGTYLINSEDRDFLKGHFRETDHKTKFVPLIMKTNGVWAPTEN